MCKTLTEGTICNGSTSFRCVCPQFQFYYTLNNTCQNQLLNNASCFLTSDCRVDLGLSCQSSKCLCDNSTQFWNGSACINYFTYADSCCFNYQCKSILKCNSGAGTCNCPSALSANKCDCYRAVGNEYYWNGIYCVPTVSFNQSCNNALASYMCKTLTEGTICNGSSSFTCVCPSLQFYYTINNTCQNQLLNNQACLLTTDCWVDLGLKCQSGKCLCNNASQFWTGSTCTNYYTYNNQTCTNASQCADILVCLLSGTSCSCPTAVTVGKCDCPSRVNGSEYYWNGTKCVPAVAYGGNCTIGASYQCQTVTQNTYCNASGICSCNSTAYYVTSWTKCVSCKSGWTMINDMCYIMFQSSIAFTDPPDYSSAAVKSFCGEATWKIAKLSNYSVLSYFQPLTLNHKQYWIDGYKSGSGYFASDGTQYNVVSCMGAGPYSGNCLVLDNPPGPPTTPPSCFASVACSGSKYAICEYVPY